MKKIAYLLALAVMLSACGHHNHEADEHEGHHHDEVSLQLTAYSADYELYAEISPLCTEEEGEFLTHITNLNDFSPLKAGKLAITLTINGKAQTVKADAPEIPGLYHLHLHPATAGKGTLSFALNDSVLATFENVNVFADEHEAIEAAEHLKISSPTAITFTKEQSWKVDFATALPQRIPFGSVVHTVAQVQSAQGDEVTVVAKSNGTLQYVAPNILEGEPIASGKTVFSISSDGYVDDNLSVRIAEAKNNYEMAKENYERATSLIDSKIVSEQEFLERKNAYENTKTIYDNLRQSSNGNSSSISSPMSGYIKQVLVANGSYVSVGQPVMVVSKNRNLVLKADIPQRYASVVSSIATANVEDPVTHKVYSLEELDGRVLSYAKSVNTSNFMLPVTLQINNVGDFTPGAFVSVWLRSQSKGNSLVVPKSSVIEEQGNYYVFVQLTPELFEKQLVKIGSTDGKNVEVLSGINENQRIVTRGAVLVKLAKAAGALDPHAGHVHAH